MSGHLSLSIDSEPAAVLDMAVTRCWRHVGGWAVCTIQFIHRGAMLFEDYNYNMFNKFVLVNPNKEYTE